MVAREIFLPKEWIGRLENADDPASRMAGAAFRALFEANISVTGDGVGRGDRIAGLVAGTELIRADRIVMRNSENALVDALVIENDLVMVGERIYIGPDLWLDAPTATLVAKSGAYMNVFGSNFGADDDLLEWYGTYRSDVSTCTKANAVAAKTNDGHLWQEGVQITGAGIQTSDAESDSTAGPTFSITATHGPGNTANGNDITLTASYECDASGSSGSSWGNPSAQLKLYEKIGAGSETLLATYALPGDFGSANSANSFEPPGLFTGFQTMSGTIPDVVRTNSASTTRVYRWELSGQSGLVLPVYRQRLTFHSSEPP